MIYTVNSAIESRLIGRIKVLLNGKVIKKCFYVDDRKGIVRYFHNPARLNKYKDAVIWQQRRGKVEIILNVRHA